MQNLQDLQEKIFFESKNLIAALSQINSKEELLSKQDLFAELGDRIAFLRILEKNKESFLQPAENGNDANDFKDEFPTADDDYFDDVPLEENRIEEEVILSNELNNIDNLNSPVDEKVAIADNEIPLHKEVTLDFPEDFEEGSTDLEDYVVSKGSVVEKEIPLIVDQELADYAERVSQKEKEFLESEERRRKIVEFDKAEVHPPLIKQSLQEEKISENLSDKKFKLSSIKGLKAVQSLFEDDYSEKKDEVLPSNPVNDFEFGSLHRSNIPTDFMEAPKKQHEFKLDFNDKIAFTKLLFRGDEEELKTTVDRLNSFTKIEDAKQYLSEVYYEKDWSKVDEYAQRLWDLVESKF